MITGEDFYGDGTMARDAALPALLYPSEVTAGVVPAKLLKGVTIEAFANHGRWLAECPYCHSAQHAYRDDRRFFCVECGNNGTGNFIKVVWPADEDIQTIEQLLDARPIVNSNWTSAEPIELLEVENAVMIETNRIKPQPIKTEPIAQVDVAENVRGQGKVVEP